MAYQFLIRSFITSKKILEVRFSFMFTFSLVLGELKKKREVK